MNEIYIVMFKGPRSRNPHCYWTRDVESAVVSALDPYDTGRVSGTAIRSRLQEVEEKGKTTIVSGEKVTPVWTLITKATLEDEFEFEIGKVEARKKTGGYSVYDPDTETIRVVPGG